MNKPWENENCDEIFGYFAHYPVHIAAALWCGIPESQINKFINESVQIDKGIYKHPNVKCLEAKCKVLHNAIDSGILAVSRENGIVVTEHIAPNRRHVSRKNLKEWIAETFPNNKPAFLFDELERKTHAAINADTFRALQADRDALRSENEKMRALVSTITNERDALCGENNSLRAMVEKNNPKKNNPIGIRPETTYLNIIGGLLELMLSPSPNGNARSVFTSQASIISSLLGYYSDKQGISDRTLEQKFAEAKRSLLST